MQCLTPCTNELWDTREFLERAMPYLDKETQEITNPDVIPKCPNCGGPCFMNVRGGDWFIEDPDAAQRKAWIDFVTQHQDKVPP